MNIKEKPEVADVRLINNHLSIELNGKVSIAPLVRLMVAEGVEIEEIRKGKASLEEAFLKLMRENNDR